MKKKDDLTYLPGDPERAGIHPTPDGWQFTAELFSDDAVLNIYGDDGEVIHIPLGPSVRAGREASVTVPAARDGMTYTYSAGGREFPDPRAPEIIECGGKHPLRGVIRELPVFLDGFICPDAADMVIYKLHVRGFTAGRGSSAKHPGTFEGVAEMIPYLSGLGINAVMLMPPYDLPDRHNYWGYTSGNYFAPEHRYSSSGSPCEEFTAMVRRLHDAGIACFVEFWFGSDEDPGLVTDVLRHWYRRLGADGFHLACRGSWEDAVMRDPLLKDTVIFHDGMQERSAGDAPDRYRKMPVYEPSYTAVNSFVRGIGELSGTDAASLQFRVSDPRIHVQYLADQNGLTPADACRDDIKRLVNSFLLLLTSSGAVLINAGDEQMNTQGGIDNAWCRDDTAGWVTWRKTRDAARLLRTVSEAVRFRKEHPVLRMVSARMTDRKNAGMPDLSLHGHSAWSLDSGDANAFSALCCGAYAGDGREDETLFLLYNMNSREYSFAVPVMPKDMRWVVLADSSREEVFYGKDLEIPAELFIDDEDGALRVTARGQSVVILALREKTKS